MATTIGSKHIWLITTIKAAGKISLKDIQKKYRDWAGNDIHEEMAVRTFHRHRNNILLNMGIDILCDRVTNEYYISNEGEMENSFNEKSQQAVTASDDVGGYYFCGTYQRLLFIG